MVDWSLVKCEKCKMETNSIDLEIIDDSWLCDDCRREIKTNQEQQEGGER